MAMNDLLDYIVGMFSAPCLSQRRRKRTGRLRAVRELETTADREIRALERGCVNFQKKIAEAEQQRQQNVEAGASSVVIKSDDELIQGYKDQLERHQQQLDTLSQTRAFASQTLSVDDTVESATRVGVATLAHLNQAQNEQRLTATVTDLRRRVETARISRELSGDAFEDDYSPEQPADTALRHTAPSSISSDEDELELDDEALESDSFLLPVSAQPPVPVETTRMNTRSSATTAPTTNATNQSNHTSSMPVKKPSTILELLERGLPRMSPSQMNPPHHIPGAFSRDMSDRLLS